MTMLRPCRTQRPLRPPAVHRQEEAVRPQRVHRPVLAIGTLVATLRGGCAALPSAAIGEPNLGAVATEPAFVEARDRVPSFSCAASARTFCASAMGLVPGGANPAALAAVPAIRTNCRHLSKSR